MTRNDLPLILAFAIFAVFLAVFALMSPHRFTIVNDVEASELDYIEVEGYVTGYNLVEGQTDDTPCIGASGKDLCGRTDAVACPRAYPLGTIVEIDSMFYICEDRLSKKYDHRWDISCDQDMDCPARVTGPKLIRVYMAM